MSFIDFLVRDETDGALRDLSLMLLSIAPSATLAMCLGCIQEILVIVQIIWTGREVGKEVTNEGSGLSLELSEDYGMTIVKEVQD